MQKKKAISLIVLIITIIVMIILASAIILSLDNVNIFNKAEDAVDKTNAKTNKYLSEIKLAERELEKIQGASKVTDANPGELAGQGTTDNPYLIESIEDLVAFSEAVNNGTTYEGEIVKLTRLLDFNSDNSYANPQSGLKETLTNVDGVGFTPIGNTVYVSGDWETTPFKGIFDGDGAEIRNLYINNDDLITAGLFGDIVGAEVKNLGVTGNITSIASIGGIVGNSHSENATSYISNCYSKVNITSDSGLDYGGIIGANYADTSNDYKLVIQDCYYTGTMKTENSWVGGIIGAGENVIINRCYNKGTINSTKDIDVGGILGTCANTTVLNSYNEGTIISDSNEEYLGGIAGWLDFGYMYNTYNAGEIRTTNCTGSGIIDCSQRYIYRKCV